MSDAKAFEKALQANPDDVAGWCAYADYLVEQGDPRGEFMQVQIALEDESRPKVERDDLKEREKALFKAYERDWLGVIAPFLLEPKPPKQEWRTNVIGYRFRRGWLHELDVPSLGVEFARALVRCPEARLLGRLHVHTTAYEYPEGSPNVPDWADGTYAPGPDIPAAHEVHYAGLHILARFPHFAAVRSLHLGNPVADDGDDTDQCHTDGAMADLYLRQMPHVEEVRLLAHRVDGDIFALPMPRLRLLQVFHATDYPLGRLAANKSLANLTHLLLQPHAPRHDDEPYIGPRELRAICRSRNLPKLSHLTLRYTTVGDEGIAEIISSGLIRRLKVLDLLGGCVTDDGARMLAACPEVKSLERLNLDTNALTADSVSRLRAAGANLTAEGQHAEVPPFGDQLPEYLFYADIE
jgi:uncharacterized protein (TIGR02996 family)